jgi:hypothetical protein
LKELEKNLESLVIGRELDLGNIHGQEWERMVVLGDESQG